MKIPLSYTWRSLWTRRLTTVLTLTGLALVVFVFSAVLMLSNGVEKTMVDTGAPDNLIVLRKSASSELVSQINRDAANIIKTFPEIALSSTGKPLLTSELVVVINLLKKENQSMANISVRGVSESSRELRPAIKMLSGKWFSSGTHEIVVGKNVTERFEGAEIGKQIKFGGDMWLIVGTFESQGSAFESEIWGDVDQLMASFNRPVYSTLTFKINNLDQIEGIKNKIQQDPRTNYVEIKGEQDFYREQSKFLSGFISGLGIMITVIFSIGATIGAMITMYAAVANRTTEIGTLRALGFRRRSVLAAFLIESLALSLVGGTVGILLSSFMSLIQISTTNFGTFSELAFSFTMSVNVIVYSLIFAVIMGFVGGFLPSFRAARMNIVNALRSS